MARNADGSSNDTEDRRLGDPITFVVAILALLGFAWFIMYLLGQTKATDLEWSRAVYLLSGVEAVAFAAAGFLFGREVHRQRAEKAENRAENAEEKASKATERAADANGAAIEAATRAFALKAAVKAKVQEQPAKADAYESLGTPTSSRSAMATLAQADIQELSRLADQLFPSS